jgi:hypothetical protein
LVNTLVDTDGGLWHRACIRSVCAGTEAAWLQGILEEVILMSKKTIAVDFDGTLNVHKFPDIGEPRTRVIEAVQREYERGSTIIIWTCRPKHDQEMRRWLERHKVPYHYVNENPEFNLDSPKVFAHEYWDDRSKHPDLIEGLVYMRDT